MNSFIGITGHFITDWKKITVMVACRTFIGIHTAVTQETIMKKPYLT